VSSVKQTMGAVTLGIIKTAPHFGMVSSGQWLADK
jgi:hypothetical protein